MCDKEGVEGQNPLTWEFNCSMGKCNECPELEVECGTNIDMSSMIDFTQWKKGSTGRVTGTSEIFGLFTVSLPVTDAISLLKHQVLLLKSHIFVAYNQWKAKGRVQNYGFHNT